MRIIVGISGASGAIMGHRLVSALKEAKPDCEIHLVATPSAEKTWELETGKTISELYEGADKVYEAFDMAAKISSGSFITDGMIILPCSMKTLAGICTGYTDNLLLRAADVCLKENRKLVICPREMPMGKIHLRNMAAAADLGCTVIPPMLTFYNGPMTIEDQMDHVIGKVLMQFGIIPNSFKPWEG